jgi:tetratricopeptide (TPR) repeat protein
LKGGRPAGFLFAVALLLAAAASVQAAPAVCGQPRQVEPGALDELTWKQFSDIQRALSEERYGEAQAALLEMLQRAGRDRYLQALVNQALGQVEWARGHFGQALGFFQAALELDALPDSAHQAVLYRLARLFLEQGRPAEALAQLEQWFCSAPPGQQTADAWVLRAAILLRLGDFAGMLEAIDAAIAREENPPEAWYQLKVAAHLELEQHARAAETLQTLLAGWPNRKRYWVQLAQAHYLLGQNQRALAVLVLAWRQGLLDEPSDILFLAGLYNEGQLPYLAASVLEQAMTAGALTADGNHWTQAAEAWQAAGEPERALVAWKAAGRTAEDGLPDLHRAYLLADLERWQEALEALDRSLARGGLSDRQAGEAHLLRGVVQYRLGDLEGAGADWDRAGHFESARAAARRWLDYLQEAQQRG